MPSGTTATVSRRPVGRGGPDVAAAGMCTPFRRWYRTISLVHPVCIIYNIRIYIYIILCYIYIYIYDGIWVACQFQWITIIFFIQIVICGYPLFSDTWKSLYIHDWHGFRPVLQSWAKKNHWCWENSKKGSDSRTLRTFFTIRIPFSNRTTMGIFPCFS